MAKTIKIFGTCSQCATKLVIPVTEADLGTSKHGVCPKCHKKYIIPISAGLASKFESDSTQIGEGGGDHSLVIETVPNNYTAYQSYELTSDYYTVGRQNNSGPEHRPDVEVATADKHMSRKHAAIRKKGKTGFTICQLPSGKNGVYYNGNKLDADEEVYLGDGDTFRLGDTTFRVSIAEHTNSDNDSTV